MGRILFAVFTIVPLIEIACFVLIGQAVGLWPTLLGVLVTALVGALVLRIQGQALFAETRATLGQGMLPGRAIADTMMVGIAGALLLTPGYFTDLFGLLLLVPPVRSAIYAALRKRFTLVATTPGAPGGGRRRMPDGTIELDDTDWRER